MRYGFVIDQNRCIGCHACTVACKQEHDIPVGVNRTWVKYIEKGEYPDTRRHFGVLRCNHCDDAPCIGCKSCMQALKRWKRPRSNAGAT
jgi:Fe-S-cluster-containing dehydrogenase component